MLRPYIGTSLRRILELVKSKMNGLGSRWKVHGGSTGRSEGLKLDSHVSNWTVQKTQSGRSAKVDGPEIRKWTAL